jgi:hypothetical protein
MAQSTRYRQLGSSPQYLEEATGDMDRYYDRMRGDTTGRIASSLNAAGQLDPAAENRIDTVLVHRVIAFAVTCAYI